MDLHETSTLGTVYMGDPSPVPYRDLYKRVHLVTLFCPGDKSIGSERLAFD